MTMEEFEEASTIIHEKVHEDANIIVGLVIDEGLGEKIKITAIATGFGETFEETATATVADVVDERSQTLAQISANVNLDVPTHIRNQQLVTPSSRRTRDLANPNHDFFVDDEQFDIPTFLRRRVD